MEGFRVVRPRKNGGADVEVYNTTVLMTRARVALDMIARWGMIAAKPGDGCDEAGRREYALQEPAELVDRACLTVELAFAEFEKRGWTLETPTPEEAERQLEEQADATERAAPRRKWI